MLQSLLTNVSNNSGCLIFFIILFYFFKQKKYCYPRIVCRALGRVGNTINIKIKCTTIGQEIMINYKNDKNRLVLLAVAAKLFAIIIY